MESKVTQKKRPLGVWIISIFTLFSLSCALTSQFLVLSGSISLPEEIASLYRSPTSIIPFVLQFIVAILRLWGAVQLFRLKRQALRLFVTSLLLDIVNTIIIFTQTNYLEALYSVNESFFNDEIFGNFIAFGVNGVICAYAWNLSQDGVLE